jgi:hypothetical protein
MRLSVGPIAIGDQVSMTGDTDHFPATMRPSPIAVEISLAQEIATSVETLTLASLVLRKI